MFGRKTRINLSLGQPVLFHPADAKDEPDTKGTIAWISTEADDKDAHRQSARRFAERRRANCGPTRSAPAASCCATNRKAIVVPTEAVHSDGDCNIVFVRDKNFFDEGAPKFFHVREVRLGVQRRRHDRNHRRLAAGRSDRQQKQHGAGSATAEEQLGRRLRLLRGGKKK